MTYDEVIAMGRVPIDVTHFGESEPYYIPGEFMKPNGIKCSFCGSRNSIEACCCTQCGAPL
jgi:hypothetical protein